MKPAHGFEKSNYFVRNLKTDHLRTPFVVWLIGFVELIQFSWIGLIDLFWLDDLINLTERIDFI